jgi:hypothetical protein
MNWSDYEAVWKRQELPRGEDADLASLRATFETKSRKLRGILWVSDMAEAGAGLLVSVALAFIWRQQGVKGWPIAFAIILTLGVTAVFIRERARAHRSRLGPEAALLQKVEADIAELHLRRRLLLGLWKWYLGPCVAAIFIVIATIMFNAPAWALTGHLIFLAGFVPMMGFLLWFAWHINQQARRKQLEPRLAELEKLRSDLLSS